MKSIIISPVGIPVYLHIISMLQFVFVFKMFLILLWYIYWNLRYNFYEAVILGWNKKHPYYNYYDAITFHRVIIIGNLSFCFCIIKFNLLNFFIFFSNVKKCSGLSNSSETSEFSEITQLTLRKIFWRIGMKKGEFLYTYFNYNLVSIKLVYFWHLVTLL